MNKKDTSWGGVAHWYDELLENKEGTYQQEVILPNLLRLVNPRKGEVLLDLACGQGFFSRAMHEKGAKIIGVDLAAELITLARKHSPKEIIFHTSQADKLTFIENNSVDKVVMVLALQNIENLSGTMSEVSRVLKKGGHFYLVLNHPAFRIPKASSWQWDEQAKSQYRRIDQYMSETREKIEMNPGTEKIEERKSTISFHRPLQVYFKAFSKAGLLVARLEEWISHKKSLAGPRQAEEDRLRKEIPLFLFLEIVKK